MKQKSMFRINTEKGIKSVQNPQTVGNFQLKIMM